MVAVRPFHSQSGDDAEAAIRVSLQQWVEVCKTHGALLRTVSEEWPHDAEIRKLWFETLETVTAGTAQVIRGARASGQAPAGADPRALAACLMWGYERVLHVALVGDAVGLPDPDAIVEPLAQMMVGGLYGQAPACPRPRCASGLARAAQPRSMHRWCAAWTRTSLGQHLDALYRAAWALCGSREDAEDLVQETFARVLARPRVIRGDERGYLMRALRNTFYSRLRTQSRRPQTGATLDDVQPPDPRAHPPARAGDRGERDPGGGRRPARGLPHGAGGRRHPGPLLRRGGQGAGHAARRRSPRGCTAPASGSPASSLTSRRRRPATHGKDLGLNGVLPDGRTHDR